MSCAEALLQLVTASRMQLREAENLHVLGSIHCTAMACSLLGCHWNCLYTSTCKQAKVQACWWHHACTQGTISGATGRARCAVNSSYACIRTSTTFRTKQADACAQTRMQKVSRVLRPLAFLEFFDELHHAYLPLSFLPWQVRQLQMRFVVGAQLDLTTTATYTLLPVHAAGTCCCQYVLHAVPRQ